LQNHTASNLARDFAYPLSNNAAVARDATAELEELVMKLLVFGVALLSVAAIFASVPARAQTGALTRSFVSSSGVDSNPCTITQPCATFAQAYTAIKADGIIAALDPGKYGPINITGPVTINGNGWSAITGTANGAGITINAGSGNVALIGLAIDGAGAAYNGIIVNSAGTLTVTNCTLQNFVNGPGATGNGILIAPSSGTLDFAITNTTAANNGSAGIAYFPPSGSTAANGVIDHVLATGNGDAGMYFNGERGSGSADLAVSNTIASYNGNGIEAFGGNVMTISIDNVTTNGNTVGISAGQPASVLLNRSVIQGNGTGISNETSNTFYTYGNNLIDLNGGGGNITSPLNTTVTLR
jgi:hypothetical protein